MFFGSNTFLQCIFIPHQNITSRILRHKLQKQHVNIKII